VTYGIISTIVGDGLADTETGRVFIADIANAVIRMVDTDGIITTIAGIGGDSGFSGEDGPASSAKSLIYTLVLQFCPFVCE
jgi:hypothetical protein